MINEPASPGPCVTGDTVQFVKLHLRALESLIHDWNNGNKVLPGGDFRYDAPESGVHFGLRRHDVGVNNASVFYDGSGSLIARGSQYQEVSFHYVIINYC